MTHWKQLLDPGIFLGPQDFQTEKKVTISRAVREDLPARDDDEKNKAKTAPMLYFTHAGKELPRKMKLPKSVMYGMSLTFGTDIDAWVGKEVTIFATKCMAFGEVEECLRIRFDQAVDSKIRKWLKKRKSSASAYMIEDRAAS